jgi:hypothetical protein
MNDWHVGPDLLTRYASGSLDLGQQSAVEEHVTRCSACLALASGAAPKRAIDEIWQGVMVSTAAPRLSPVLKLLNRIGLRETDAVILRASNALYRPWLLSLVGAIVFAVAGSVLAEREQRLFYLLIAPLLPALTVAAAYDATDPMREVAVSTPFSKLRIALLRTALAVAVALPVVLAVGLVLPFIGTEAFAWLLPALTLTLLALTLLTWWTAPVAGGAVAGTWLVVVTLLRAADQLASVATPAAQLAFAAAALLTLVLLTVRLTSFHGPGGYA